MPRRLLLCVNDLGFFLSHRLPVALKAIEAGWEVHLVTSQEKSPHTELPPAITHHQICLSRGGTGLLQELRTFVELYRTYRKIRPTVVHNVTIKPVVYGGICARLARVPAMVAAVSGLGYVFIGDTLRRRLLRWALVVLYKLAVQHPNSRVIFQNPDDQQTFKHLGITRPGQSTLIRGSGVDLQQFQYCAEPDGVPVVLMSCRLLREKGVLEFARAARAIKKSVDCRCVLAGDLDFANPSALRESDLSAWIEDGSIEWVGYRQDMRELLRKCHVYVLPSYREGLPKALIEAAATGRALVTTDVPGCREVVRDHENGLLVPARDSEALANAILVLLRDPQLRQRMGKHSRERAEMEFSIDSVVQQHLVIYDELLSTCVGS